MARRIIWFPHNTHRILPYRLSTGLLTPRPPRFRTGKKWWSVWHVALLAKPAFAMACLNAFCRADWSVQDIAVEEQERRKGQVLRRGADLFLHSKMGQKGIDFRLGDLHRMAHMVEKDETFDPMAVGLLGPTAVMARAQGFPQLIEEFRFPDGRMGRRRRGRGRRR